MAMFHWLSAHRRDEESKDALHWLQEVPRSSMYRLVLTIACLVSAWTLIFPPRAWHHTPSLDLVRSYPVPLWSWSLPFLFAGLALSLTQAPKWHARGCWVALADFLLFVVSLACVTRPDRPANFVLLSLGVVGLASILRSAQLAEDADEKLRVASDESRG